MAMPAAFADTLILDNGDRLRGTFLAIDDGALTFRPDGTDQALSLPLDAVAQLQTEDTIAAALDNGAEARGQAAEANNGTIRLDSVQSTEPGTVPVQELSRVSESEDAAREPIETSGDITLGARITDGNTRSQTYSATADTRVRREANRLRFEAELHRARDDGEDTEDRTAAGIRYDHFVSERLYLNSNVSVARDRFRDLRLRTVAGLGLGYQVFDTDTRTLSAELGVSYVNEDFYEAENESNPAGRWALDYEERLAGDGVRLFHAQEGLVNLEDAEDLRVHTRTGVRFPFVVGMTGTVQVNFDYDNQPPGDTRRADTAYLLTAGYSW
ncbi:YdiY family protein [Aquisalimonas sp.]|uniref:DUF481 domain-containing protein n=1 Tax=Aquisalimonas sp. TaxID=1872621 RepID=UPI0025C60FDE|nr:DUF481 domain-containing protein [Aquisalimonas sp.]